MPRQEPKEATLEIRGLTRELVCTSDNVAPIGLEEAKW